MIIMTVYSSVASHSGWTWWTTSCRTSCRQWWTQLRRTQSGVEAPPPPRPPRRAASPPSSRSLSGTNERPCSAMFDVQRATASSWRRAGGRKERNVSDWILKSGVVFMVRRRRWIISWFHAPLTLSSATSDGGIIKPLFSKAFKSEAAWCLGRADVLQRLILQYTSQWVCVCVCVCECECVSECVCVFVSTQRQEVRARLSSGRRRCGKSKCVLYKNLCDGFTNRFIWDVFIYGNVKRIKTT